MSTKIEVAVLTDEEKKAMMRQFSRGLAVCREIRRIMAEYKDVLGEEAMAALEDALNKV